ncbi:unnamed protein product [Clonostachys byssicola]|uniref:Uncharacterized protein n=1 Tax=Clonostachys byssicola TaxID=160290 RepID=A0A9N9UEQ6_9HYPO|nr:unnamed protein product [Clonostachys byssicola]
MAPEKLQVAATGLGRIGKRYAIDFLNRTSRAELPGLNTVFIGTAASVHADEAIQAMQKNLHVLCEKPLSTSISILLKCHQVVEEAKKHPHLKVMCGFPRRFDESYHDARNKAEQGLIGRPSIIRSQTCDKRDPSVFFIAYDAWSGGVFVDVSVHDIDLTLWFFADDIQPKSVSAHSIRAV